MTHDTFRASLRRLGLTQTSFCAQVESAGGEKLSLRTVNAWATGERPIPPLVPMVLALMERVPQTPPETHSPPSP